MIEIEIQRRGLDIGAFADRLSGKITRRLVERAAGYTYRTMRQKAPEGTGRLRESIREVIRGSSATVGPTVPYAVYVEYGTRPHMIRPVRASALSFESAGEVLFAKYVRHPGTRPQRFVRETAEETRRAVRSLFREVWSEEVRP